MEEVFVMGRVELLKTIGELKAKSQLSEQFYSLGVLQR
jgi:hypothetical protein